MQGPGTCFMPLAKNWKMWVKTRYLYRDKFGTFTLTDDVRKREVSYGARLVDEMFCYLSPFSIGMGTSYYVLCQWIAMSAAWQLWKQEQCEWATNMGFRTKSIVDLLCTLSYIFLTCNLVVHSRNQKNVFPPLDTDNILWCQLRVLQTGCMKK